MPQSAEEICNLLSNPEEYSNFKCVEWWTTPQYNVFHIDLPTKDIMDWFESEKEATLSQMPLESRVQLEHIGSTSVPGMCGTKNPDAVMTVQIFPPQKKVIETLLSLGFTLVKPPGKGGNRRKVQSVWFIKRIKSGCLKGQYFKIHLARADSRPARGLVKTRDILRTDNTSFEKYQEAKIQASQLLETDFTAYKAYKAKSLPNTY